MKKIKVLRRCFCLPFYIPPVITYSRRQQAGKPYEMPWGMYEYLRTRLLLIYCKHVHKKRKKIFPHISFFVKPAKNKGKKLPEYLYKSMKKTKALIYHKDKNGFYVYVKPKLCDIRAAIKCIGRYLVRPAIALKRIDSYDGNSVTFHYSWHEDNLLSIKSFRSWTLSPCSSGISLTGISR